MAKTTDPKATTFDPPPATLHPTVPTAWNPEDMALLSSEQEKLGAKVLGIETELSPFSDRLSKLEADVAILDPSRSLLPSEVVRGLPPAEVYKSVLTAGLTALLMSEPHLVNDTKHRVSRIDRILDLCDTVLDRVCVRAGTNLKK